VGGKANGQAVLTNQPLNMLSMIDTKSGEIKDENHELFKRTLKNKILIFPLAIICLKKCDTITASGCAISDIPLVDNLDLDIRPLIEEKSEIFLDADNQKIAIKKV